MSALLSLIGVLAKHFYGSYYICLRYKKCTGNHKIDLFWGKTHYCITNYRFMKRMLISFKVLFLVLFCYLSSDQFFLFIFWIQLHKVISYCSFIVKPIEKVIRDFLSVETRQDSIFAEARLLTKHQVEIYFQSDTFFLSIWKKVFFWYFIRTFQLISLCGKIILIMYHQLPEDKKKFYLQFTHQVNDRNKGIIFISLV